MGLECLFLWFPVLEHHSEDYVTQNETEEILLNLGIAKVGHDDAIFNKVAEKKTKSDLNDTMVTRL